MPSNIATSTVPQRLLSPSIHFPSRVAAKKDRARSTQRPLDYCIPPHLQEKSEYNRDTQW
jgi:hypothetical protein